jgi:hypothetical protein
MFDLARSIDARQNSIEGTEERAVAGVTTGLIGKPSGFACSPAGILSAICNLA